MVQMLYPGFLPQKEYGENLWVCDGLLSLPIFLSIAAVLHPESIKPQHRSFWHSHKLLCVVWEVIIEETITRQVGLQKSLLLSFACADGGARGLGVRPQLCKAQIQSQVGFLHLLAHLRVRVVVGLSCEAELWIQQWDNTEDTKHHMSQGAPTAKCCFPILYLSAVRMFLVLGEFGFPARKLGSQFS